MSYDVINIGDVADVYSGYAFKSKDFDKSGIPIIKIKNIQNKRVHLNSETFFNPQKVTEKLKKFWLENDDVLIAMTGQGSVGRVGRIKTYGKKTLLNQRVGKFIVDKNKLDLSFLYYVLSSSKYEQILFDYGTGSGQPNLSPTIIKSVEIPFPSLQEQKATANILSSLDDKIELNNKFNQNLETLAQTLYKHWFVDFEFPNVNGEPYKSSGGEMVDSELGLIPKGWQILNLDDRFAFERGIEPGSKNYQHIKDSESIPFYRVGDLNQKTSLFVDKALVKDKVVLEDDILVSFDGAIGRIGIGFSGAYSTGLRKVYDKENEISNSYIYNMMKSSQIQDTMNAHANGTTILHAGSSIPFLKVAFNNISVKDYENIINPIFDKILEIIKENQKLAEIRDTILPKLMNSEIEVPV